MGMGKNIAIRHLIAKRAAQEIKEGMVINLGIGIPTLVADYIPEDQHVLLHAENGILGTGPTPAEGEENPMLCNAGGFPVSVKAGASYFDSAIAFAITRRGKLDMTILGALEVSQTGDLANWIVPGKRVPGMGGAIDLAQKAKRVVIVTNHCNRQGKSKIVKECVLPLTAKACVDLIITERAVMEVTGSGLILTEVMEPYTIEEVIESTEADLLISNQIKWVKG
ncbi:acyl CoA:acetate/3-ketoacid CoA transferase subunit beta [Ammoniphilus oxalaticus]|uniref:Acyl CoA:acetate/3-ketoacid CoA transferase subunit beta n=1 Tax=Ammoniphilus oxalaticus TaxID=66863 RepID=A0A419SJE8_9BACL|nr:3-oxoacid CoA-transferase subunit B [Ammoniphilus oxalaticus]RKD24028.1 acyl CoA:acetate/3-ketoacid CoA transferase subunit beta [Ammoniphilus oxalaticus]